MRKIERSVGHRKIAGVCGGLGESLELDPVLFRLLFLGLLAFGGLGVIAYLAMWLMVPLADGPRTAPELSGLRLSRTDRTVGGVCGGLGTFLDVDPVLFRVAFVVATVAGGLGVVLYAVCWLVIPRAEDAHRPAASDADGGPLAGPA
jgi:phage shock protein PspC (stress-responsive transcriptional regulator)